MPYDYTQEKTPIFTDINDKPQPATASQGSNASDLITKVNKIADELNNDFANIGSNNNFTQTVTLKSTNFADYNNKWFGGSASKINILIVQVPFYKSLFSDFGGNSNDLNDYESSLDNDRDYLFQDVDASQNDIDISTAFTTPAMYLFIPYDVSVGAYSSTFSFPTQSNRSLAISIDKANSKGNFTKSDIAKDFSAGSIVHFGISNTPWDYDAGIGNRLDYLLIYSMDFDITLTLGKDGDF